MVKNPVEQALAEAIRDPGARPEFYRLLLDSDVYVVTANSQEELRKGSLWSGGTEAGARKATAR